MRNVTQTSVTLEWPSLQLSTAKLRSLDIYRNGQRLAVIPSPLTNNSTKLSGLELNNEYSFQLVLRTTAGTFPSNLIRVRTHSMSDTSGISVCFGNVQDKVLLENAKAALKEMKAKWSDKIQIDTTHFVCTTPASTSTTGQTSGGAGVEYQRALQLSIPVVQPHWILACHSERKYVPSHSYTIVITYTIQYRMIPIASFYLGANPTTPTSYGSQRQQSTSQANINHSPSASQPHANISTGPTTTSQNPANRASMPPPSRSEPPQSAFVGQAPQKPEVLNPTPEEEAEQQSKHEAQRTASKERRRSRQPGSMNKAFKFPPTSPTTPPGLPKRSGDGDDMESVSVVAPSSVEVPPPPPVEKERSTSGQLVEDGEGDDVGETEEISLN